MYTSETGLAKLCFLIKFNKIGIIVKRRSCSFIIRSIIIFIEGYHIFLLIRKMISNKLLRFNFCVCDGTSQFISIYFIQCALLWTLNLYIHEWTNEPFSCHGRLGQYSGHIFPQRFSLPSEHLGWEGPSSGLCAALATPGPWVDHGWPTDGPRLPAYHVLANGAWAQPLKESCFMVCVWARSARRISAAWEAGRQRACHA